MGKPAFQPVFSLPAESTSFGVFRPVPDCCCAKVNFPAAVQRYVLDISLLQQDAEGGGIPDRVVIRYCSVPQPGTTHFRMSPNSTRFLYVQKPSRIDRASTSLIRKSNCDTETGRVGAVSGLTFAPIWSFVQVLIFTFCDPSVPDRYHFQHFVGVHVYGSTCAAPGRRLLN